MCTFSRVWYNDEHHIPVEVKIIIQDKSNLVIDYLTKISSIFGLNKQQYET